MHQHKCWLTRQSFMSNIHTSHVHVLTYTHTYIYTTLSAKICHFHCYTMAKHNMQGVLNYASMATDKCETAYDSGPVETTTHTRTHTHTHTYIHTNTHGSNSVTVATQFSIQSCMQHVNLSLLICKQECPLWGFKILRYNLYSCDFLDASNT